MGRTAVSAVSVEERVRQNWIKELNSFGISYGPNQEPLNKLSTSALRWLIVKEDLKRN